MVWTALTTKSILRNLGMLASGPTADQPADRGGRPTSDRFAACGYLGQCNGYEQLDERSIIVWRNEGTDHAAVETRREQPKNIARRGEHLNGPGYAYHSAAWECCLEKSIP